MKNLYLLIFAVLLAGSCEINRKIISYDELCKATEEYPESHTARFETIPDTTNLLECGLPASGTIKGYCNLMGNFIPEKSPFTIWHWQWDPKSNGRKIYESIEGTITGENGDCYFFNGIIVYDVKRESFMGEMYINGGLGKLDGITGKCYMKGDIHEGITMWSAQGTLAMKNGQDNNEIGNFGNSSK